MFFLIALQSQTNNNIIILSSTKTLSSMSISMSKDYGSHFIRKGEDKAKIRKGV
jgi:hypothetical protein